MKVKILTRMALTIALAYILSLIDLMKLPAGGGISLESLPLMLFSAIEGPLYGAIAGFSYGLLLITKPSAFIHPVQFLLDYPLAYSSFFILGFIKINSKLIFKSCYAVLAFLLRFIFHSLSGIFFVHLFLKTMPKNPALYILGYNATYLAPTAFICCLLYVLLSNAISKRAT